MDVAKAILQQWEPGKMDLTNQEEAVLTTSESK